MAPQDLGRLIHRQLRRWQLRHPVAIHETPSPCVALSRLTGSRGVDIGRRVAEWLDYGFFDEEIVDWIAGDAGVQRQLVEGLDECARSGLERDVAAALAQPSFSEAESLRDASRIVAILGGRGMAVIAGRGAPFLLTPDRALRVLVIAPAELRARRLAEDLGLDGEQAQARLEREDRERSQLYRSCFGLRQDDPLLYDLVVNTAQIGVEGAARMVVDALRSRFPHEKSVTAS